MSAQIERTYRWKASDLVRLPEEPFLRFEIVDGELIVSRRPEWQHQRIIRNLLFAFADLTASGGEALPEPGLVLNDEAEDNVIPDIAVILPNRLHLLSGPKLSGAPNIAIEVVSPGSIETDYVKKRELYRRLGVEEYWIVDSSRRTIEVWRFAGKATSQLYRDGDIIGSDLFPSLSVDVARIW